MAGLDFTSAEVLFIMRFPFFLSCLLALGLTACPGPSTDTGIGAGCPSPYGMHGDADHDGWTPAQGDCDDCSTEVGPNFPDTSFDGVDNDCDGVDGDAAPHFAPASDGFVTSPLGMLDLTIRVADNDPPEWGMVVLPVATAQRVSLLTGAELGITVQGPPALGSFTMACTVADPSWTIGGGAL